MNGPHLDAVAAEQVQHVLVQVLHLFGVHGVRPGVKTLQVPKQELQGVPQLGEKEEENCHFKLS